MDGQIALVPEEFAKRVARDLEGDRCVVLLAPRTVRLASLSQTIADELTFSGFGVLRVTIDEAAWEKKPAQVILEALEVEDAWRGNGPGDVIHHPYCPEVVLVDFEGTPQAVTRSMWAEFALNWADALHHDAPEDAPYNPKIAVLATDCDEFRDARTGMVKLVAESFAGTVSQLHLRSLARAWQSQCATWPDRLWAESVFVEIAGWDPDLLSALLSQFPQTDLDLKHLLSEEALARGWSEEVLRGHSVESLALQGGVAAALTREDWLPRWRGLWREGLVDYVQEVGVELHSIAASILGWERVLAHRAWRGQVRFLLPLIDGARLGICLRVSDPGPERRYIHQSEDWYAKEFHDLSDTVRRNRARLGAKDGSVTRALTGLWNTRNELAHYEPLSRGQFEDCLGYLKTISEWVATG